jgi:sigma-B regulation protein RsbU (phosphoserine phosphatase)
MWALGWGVIGLGVGIVISLGQEGFTKNLSEIVIFGPTTQFSFMFAEVVGLTALSSSRLIFPYYATLPYIPRLLLQIATVGGGTFFGTVVVSLSLPYFAMHEYRSILAMVLVNGTLALVVSIAVHTYESMKRQIQKSYEDLRKKEAFDREMDIAREVQEQLFPKAAPRVHGLQVAGICLPAAGVGGDYYDYLPIADNRLGLVVADVSGKGISAALLMASLHASVRNVIAPEIAPSEIACRLNTFLYRSTTAARYATLFIGMFDGRDGSFCYSNAGHNPPLVLRASGAHRLSEGGLPLGIFNTVQYCEGRWALEPDDLLLLYTDGAIEAADPSGREFGMDRLVSFLQERRRSNDLPGLIRQTLAEIHSWTQASPQQDDITVVLARAAGPE